MSLVPDHHDARRIAAEVLGEDVRSCERFTTGLRHWVYDIELVSGDKIVVRMSHPEHRNELAGGIYWHAELGEVGVPVAAIVAHDVEADQPYMILERLPGTDLGNVFDALDHGQRQNVATAVIDMQQRASTLPPATGFGYALHYNSQLQHSWQAVLDGQIERAARAIRRVGLVDEAWIGRVELLLQHADGLEDVGPTAFLHDATTKNVIVSNGRVTGLVDVDEMAFGDALYTTALTRMSLISARRETEYVDLLLGDRVQDRPTRARLDVYTAIHALGFLAELGQSFNRAVPKPVEQAHLELLETTLESLLTAPR